VKYSEYDVMVQNGRKYIIPAPNARMSIYDPLANAEEMVTDFLNYGKELYTQKNRKRLMETKEYIDFFTTHSSKRHDPEIAYFMRRDDIYDIVFSARYMEPLAWGTAISENLYTHFLRFRQNFNSESSSDGQPASSGVTMKYTHPGISLLMRAEDSPEMLWCFDSLKTMLEVAYCTLLSADAHPLRICKHCGKIYYHTPCLCCVLSFDGNVLFKILLIISTPFSPKRGYVTVLET